MHCFQQGHIHSNTATPPNNAILHGPNIQTHESTETIPIQTTTGQDLLHNLKDTVTFSDYETQLDLQILFLMNL